MIILIVVGAIIVFVAWTSARKRKRNDDERREAEDSTEKFKQDLEKTANEIIGRMEEQATRLEKLLNDAEHSRAQLEGRIAELKKLIQRCERQSLDAKDVLARLEDTLDDVDTFQHKINSKPARQPVQRVSAPVTPIAPPNFRPPQPAPVQDFAEVLEQSLTEKSPPKRSEPPTKKVAEISTATTSDSEQSETETPVDTSVVREMLEAGMTVEEIARETGLGRGAILLVQQMSRRKPERR